jgi:hypothetical protein
MGSSKMLSGKGVGVSVGVGVGVGVAVGVAVGCAIAVEVTVGVERAVIAGDGATQFVSVARHNNARIMPDCFPFRAL